MSLMEREQATKSVSFYVVSRLFSSQVCPIG